MIKKLQFLFVKNLRWVVKGEVYFSTSTDWGVPQKKNPLVIDYFPIMNWPIVIFTIY
jgi:hypothetical protein